MTRNFREISPRRPIPEDRRAITPYFTLQLDKSDIGKSRAI
jgi:hypothetical protein